MTSQTSTIEKPSRILNVALWVCQFILAAVFGMAGGLKTFMPIPELAMQLGWPGDVSPMLVRFIGIAECVASLGLILPSLLRIKPKLTVWAAMGLVMLMVSAMLFHISRGEMQAIPINLTFALLAAFVAWGRSTKAVIQSR